MKRIFFLLLLALPTLTFSKTEPVANDLGPGLEAIKTALSAGDIAGLSKFFGESVEISILGDEQAYSKADAAAALRDFFGKNKPKTFSQLHTGTSRGSSDQYCIGDLSTASTTYRVYFFMKNAGDKTTIQELRFDEE